ncbi:expressed unknown protein [Seminavis robusta]|uniref:Uncharacterized protein n=1 Tax=Seminavis robusta TaxID=568900 RepID=A0A9N8E3U2_9STRA|nr:expressed unknown protein [Seminavis robusta]|eukprot:Sro524_g160050.1 n/a (461) ;mRNA; r:47598-49104
MRRGDFLRWGAISSSNSSASTLKDSPQKTAIREVKWAGIPPSGDRAQPSLMGFLRSYWRHNRLCKTFFANADTANNTSTLQRLNVTLGCQEIHEYGQAGIGNYATAIYGIRLAAQALKVDLHMTCHDAIDMSSLLVLPWLLGHFPVSDDATDRASLPSINRVCSTFNKVPIGYLLDQIQFDMRRMALSVVGIPPSSANHPATAWASKYLEYETALRYPYQPQLQARHHNPLVKSNQAADMDDVVVHFRCGDIMIGSAAGSYYGFQKFHEILRHISPAARSIGIATQPFADDEEAIDSRTNQTFKTPLDRSIGNRCKLVVFALIDTLHERFPKAAVRVHNGKDESIVMAYTRMIMANQTIAAAMSSFSVFPIVSTFGTGYLPRPRSWGSPYSWVEQEPRIKDMARDNVVLVKADARHTISGIDMRALWDAKGEALALEWFRNTSLVLNCTKETCKMDAKYR